MDKGVFLPADILIPTGIPLHKWSVIACDQFSAERSYWERVNRTVGGSPSTINMIIPETYLDHDITEHEIKTLCGEMDKYLKNGLFECHENALIYVERTLSDGRVRRGLVGMLDLEAYEFTPNSKAPVRASENTILSRLPPRMRVRTCAELELPHVMALIEDKMKAVIEPITLKTDTLTKVYDFKLMEGGGHLKGWRLDGADCQQVLDALASLRAGSAVHIIVGDGNHSLAAAKECWEAVKPSLSEAERETHPARFSLIELNNVYDTAIDFEAIHRVVFDTEPEALFEALKRQIPQRGGAGYPVRCVWAQTDETVTIPAGSIGELIAFLQTFLDGYLAENGGSIDYIHGDSAVLQLSNRKDACGFLLPAMGKDDFFATVSRGGVFPKKSFSIGHAQDKRYYLECRQIR